MTPESRAWRGGGSADQPLHADECGKGWGERPAVGHPRTKNGDCGTRPQLLSRWSLGTKTDLSYGEGKGGWGEKCGCN